MASSFRRFGLALVLVLCASNAGAGIPVPDPAFSTIEGDLMVGNARGLPLLPLANVRPGLTDGYQVIVRDLNNVPIAGSTVRFEFAGTGVSPHATQAFGQIANCAAQTISAVTDALGRVTLMPATVGVYTNAAPGVIIRADGVILGAIRYRSVDLVNTAGSPGVVDGQDANAFRLRLLGLGGETIHDPETDYATEGPSAGQTDGFDFNVFRVEVLCGVAGAPVQAPCTSTRCP